MSTRIEVRYRVLTPLFCAGACHSRPELRLPSFKGALRFWWRTLAWSRYRANLKVIRQQEDNLFGSASGGQSRLSMRLVSASDPLPVGTEELLTLPPTNARVVGEGARYLGYGVMEAFDSRRKCKKAGQLTRACLRAPFDFTVQMRGRGLSECDNSLLNDALTALGTLGGMGAKSRKGYGSLALLSLRVNEREESRASCSEDDLCAAIRALRRDCSGTAMPKFTALSEETRHVMLSSDKAEPLELLDLVGRELIRYRSWGRNGKVFGGGIDSERNFEDDHDLMRRDAAEREAHPRRIVFGLPHNYGKPRSKQITPAAKDIDRRASPLFIHIHECSGLPIAILSFLPARFLPEGKSRISVGGNGVCQMPEKELYRPIHEFLDRLLDSRKRKEPFTKVVEVER